MGFKPTIFVLVTGTPSLPKSAVSKTLDLKNPGTVLSLFYDSWQIENDWVPSAVNFKAFFFKGNGVCNLLPTALQRQFFDITLILKKHFI